MEKLLGVSGDLSALVNETHPNKNTNLKIKKLNPKIVKALIKVIIDDTKYEIYNLRLYIDYLKGQIKRLEQIRNYKNKMDNAHNKKNRAYYEYLMQVLLENGENFKNYEQVLEEYKEASVVRKKELDKLYKELKSIKQLRV